MLVAVIKETDTLVMSQSRLDRFSQLPAFQGVLSTIYHTDNTAYIFNGNLDCITIMTTRINSVFQCQNFSFLVENDLSAVNSLLFIPLDP